MQKYKPLIKLARDAILAKLENKEIKVSEKIKSQFSEKLACFVTLTINKELRGCIGSLVARQELWKDVAQNSVHAAFDDFRFMPLTKEELDKVKIEISVLSVPKKLEYEGAEDLLNKINPDMGIILKKDSGSATFLPQVWEQIPDKIDFLEHLSMKAGLNKDDWKTAEYEYYGVESVEED